MVRDARRRGARHGYSARTGAATLDDDGKAWLGKDCHRIELFRLPAYSPEFNPIEGVWKVVKKQTTHNRFFHTTEERDAALTATFERLDAQPRLTAGHVERFLG